MAVPVQAILALVFLSPWCLVLFSAFSLLAFPLVNLVGQHFILVQHKTI